jgi:hypothetical protein
LHGSGDPAIQTRQHQAAGATGYRRNHLIAPPSPRLLPGKRQNKANAGSAVDHGMDKFGKLIEVRGGEWAGPQLRDVHAGHLQ